MERILREDIFNVEDLSRRHLQIYVFLKVPTHETYVRKFTISPRACLFGFRTEELRVIVRIFQNKYVSKKRVLLMSSRLPKSQTNPGKAERIFRDSDFD